MDDMRIAELCWVLLNLARSRQIVVATGNQNFLELMFQRALPIRDHVEVVAHFFESMSSEGPLIDRHWRTNDSRSMSGRVA